MNRAQVQPTRIALLPEVVRNQIAAGEVIERPASVVKELVENSIDAGSTHIEVELEEGGMRLVRITDDGCGMVPEDLELAFCAHATSKLREASDLEHIVSLGFRGEALASMGAIARCSILSRTREAETGSRIENEGGDIRGPVDAGAPLGTSIEVRDLFYNTPGRRHFLKRAETELGRCLDVVQRAALSTSGVGFVVKHNGKRVLDVESSMDLRSRIRRIFGTELGEELVAVSAESDGLVLSGFLAPPRFSRRDTSRQMFFLNGRSVRDKLLVRAVKDAYRGFLVEGRQPVAFLNISLDPALVDVNVHPTKTEVRFRDSRRIMGFLIHNLREAVRTTDMSTPGDSMISSARRREESGGPSFSFPRPVPGGYPSPARGAGEPLEIREVPGRPFSDVSPRPDSAGAVSAAGAGGTETAVPQSAGSEEGASQAYRGEPSQAYREEPSQAYQEEPSQAYQEEPSQGPVLQIDRTYLIREIRDEQGGFEIIDQHALHERITYEGLKEEVRHGKVEIQRFLMPELVEVSRSDVRRIEPHLEELASIGVEISVFGEATLSVSGLPARLRRPNAERLVVDLLSILEETGKAPKAEEVIEEVLHSMACRSSIMAGDELVPEAIDALLARGRALESDQTCPHARPTRVRFTLADLEKAFHRR